jgi:hypothetical protein
LCGIAGYVAYDNKYDPCLYAALTNMALHMQNRGSKSWGYTNGKDIIKSLGKIEDGWNYSFADFGAAAIHTRHPTIGNLTEENSHPFKIGEIIGMHNGCVNNHYELLRKYDRNCQVDSEHIFHHIDKGISLSDINAYGAIVFWKDGMVHLGRFNGGDLTLAHTKMAWLFSSTEVATRQSARFAGLSKEKFILCKLNDDNVEVVGDLDFGPYSKSYGAWNDNMFEDSAYISPSQYNARRSLPSTTPFVVAPKAEEVKTDKTINTFDVQVTSMIMAVTAKVRAIKQLKNDLLDKNTVTLGLETLTTKDWSCGICHTPITSNDMFSLTTECDIICEDCAISNETLVSSNVPLTTLPVDILKYDSIVGENSININKRLSCEECTFPFVSGDSVVILKDSSVICVSCFEEGHANEDNDEDENEDEIKDVEYKDLGDDPNFLYENSDKRITLSRDGMFVRVKNKLTNEFSEFPKSSTAGYDLLMEFAPERLMHQSLM